MIRIKILRLEHDMSQRDLAGRIGCSQKSIDYWEKGEADPSARFICALADCFACSADYLLGREDDFGVVRIEGGLTEEERELLHGFSALSKPRRQELLNYIEFILSQDGGTQ